jgi:cytochrome bd-type quinol oxidase subunit 1
VRYILLAVIVPLMAIQLWITVSNGGMRVRNVLTRTFSPQSMFVYACGFLVFAVVPYLLLQKTISIQRSWLEISLLLVRLGLSALLILIGWVTTVGALSILNAKRT